MFKPLKIIITLDGTGVYYDHAEPPMLDGILSAALSRFHVHGEPPARNEEPFDIPIPLQRWDAHGTWGWHASAFFPDDGAIESLQYWRKRFRQNRVELTDKNTNLTNGVYRDWNMPLPLLLTPRLVAYAVGERSKIQRELRRSLTHIGKKRAYGRGAVVAIDVDVIEQDFSLQRDGLATRWFPSPNGTRLVRTRPPYWNTVGRVPCLEIGERMT